MKEGVSRVYVSKTQARRALLALRRRSRDGDLAAAIKEMEGHLEHRYGSFFPLNSLSRGNKDYLDILRQGTRRNLYRLNGQKLLQGGSLSEVDELDWSDHRPLLQIVLEIADLADTCYALRGRNGSFGWGMLSNGFSRLALTVVDPAEGLHELLIGQLESAADQFAKQVEAALEMMAESPVTQLLRQEYYRLADEAAEDYWFCQLLTNPDHQLVSETESFVLYTLMADPQKPRRCSWQAMAAAKLGILSNAACDDGWPPRPELRVIPGVPRQRRPAEFPAAATA